MISKIILRASSNFEARIKAIASYNIFDDILAYPILNDLIFIIMHNFFIFSKLSEKTFF